MFYSQRKNWSLVFGTGGGTTSRVDTDKKKKILKTTGHENTTLLWMFRSHSGTCGGDPGPRVIQEAFYVIPHLRQAVSQIFEGPLRTNNRSGRQVQTGGGEGLETLRAEIKTK